MHVFCVGMYRACSTWQYEVVCHLLETHRGARRLGYVTGPEYAALLRSGALNRDDWAVLKSHDEDPHLAQALHDGQALAVYSYRDLRDVAYSMRHKLGVSFETLIRQGVLHRILANDRFWTAQPRVLSQRYEALQAAPASGVAELAAHLGLDLPLVEAVRLAEEYALDANRRRAEALRQDLQARGLDLSDPANQLRYDSQTLLHWNHLRRGAIGDWRDRATPEHRARLGRICGDWLIKHGYESDNTWASTDQAARRLNAISLTGDLVLSRLNCEIYRFSLYYPRFASVLRQFFGRRRQVATANTQAAQTSMAPSPRSARQLKERRTPHA